MKGFRFRLDRVLAWRQTQLSVETAKLEGLLSQKRALEEQKQKVIRDCAATQALLGETVFLRGVDLARVEAARIWAQREERRLASRLNETGRAIEDQRSLVAGATHRVRLLERLRDRRQAEWEAASEKEIEDLGADLAIAKWRREGSQSEL